MSKIAFIFPGQGSQFVGMGKDFYDEYKVAKEVFETADDVLNYKLSEICFNGPEDELMLTEHTQPAILTTSIAILKVLEQEGFSCDYTAGLSLGEYSALINTKSLEFSQAVKLVKNRGIYMQQAVPSGVGRMGAIVGLTMRQIEGIIENSKEEGLIQIANYNTYEQIVVSGEKKAVSSALKMAKELGARKALPLLVSAPFHCSLLEPAGKLLSNDLKDITFQEPNIPFVSNVNAEVVVNKDKIPEYLVKQVSNAVLWRQSVEYLLSQDVRTFIEIGPGTTLSNFVKSITAYKEIDVISESVSDVEGLNQVIKILGR